jgi:hypothetical protein
VLKLIKALEELMSALASFETPATRSAVRAQFMAQDKLLGQLSAHFLEGRSKRRASGAVTERLMLGG